MKLFYKTFIIFFVITATFIFANEWVSTGNIRPASPEWEVNSISDSNIEINFSLMMEISPLIFTIDLTKKIIIKKVYSF